MTTAPSTFRSLPRRPLAILAMAVVFAIGSQVIDAHRTVPTMVDPVVVDPPAAAIDAPPAAIDPLGATATDADLARIQANIVFWSQRAERAPRDFISATRWAESEIELARATGDISGYTVAEQALDAALAIDPTYGLALGYRGVVLIALHRFPEAIEHAKAILADRPDDLVSLGTLGDGRLEIGDLAGARKAYERLATLDPSASALVRLGHLAFVEGDGATAVTQAKKAVDAAAEEGAAGSAMAWYDYQYGDVATATGDAVTGRAAYEAALAADPSSHLARWGLARILAADGDLDGAIAQLDAAIERIPLPEFLARRSDLYELRGANGDAARVARDRATVLAIAQLGGTAASVRDRQLSLYLSSHGLDPERALRLAEREIAVRDDAFGYDALAWALQANGRSGEAQGAMDTARATGIKDARMLYHAGVIALALGHDDGRSLLQAALDLDPTFDPRDVATIRRILSGS
jgi:tetratricopeptide (TPR) repeat protein